MRTNLHHLLEQAADHHGQAPALTYKQSTVSYGELWRLTEKTGAGLATLGLSRDDRVGIYLDKRIETVAAVFGTSVASGSIRPGEPRPQATSGWLHPE